MSKFWTGLAKITGVIPALIFFKPKIYYANKKVQGKKLPKPCILMSNHNSLMDFVLYLLVFYWRNIRFLMAEVLFSKNKLLTFILYKLGGIKVDRTKFDFAFIGECLELLDRKKSVGIFPEGQLPVDGQHFPFKPGIVLVALRTDAPIVPVVSDGRYGITKRAHIIIGEPINVREYYGDNPTEDQIRDITARLEDINNGLFDTLKEKINEKK